MDSIVLKLCYDGWWETLEDERMEYVNGKNIACFELCYDGWWEALEDGRMEYVNGKNIVFFVGKNYFFDQLLTRVYDVL